ncbi:hypothetical protein C4588_04265 [Candidatus Parcubacteria bacterium]|nr:MAG: hypothetical protein C4588_04265 [Candidatus Parcubacteria bacterium]
MCREARDRAAEYAVHGLCLLRPLLDGKEITELEKIRRIALAIDDFQTIARLLESVGAQTRP